MFRFGNFGFGNYFSVSVRFRFGAKFLVRSYTNETKVQINFSMVDFAFTKYLTVLYYTPEEEGAFLVWLLTLHLCSRNAKLSIMCLITH